MERIKYKLKHFENVESLTYSLGFEDRNALYMIRHATKDKFSYICSLNEYFDIAIKLYIEDVKKTLDKLCDMFYWLEDNKLIGTFGKKVVEEKIYNSNCKYLFSINLRKRCFKLYDSDAKYISIRYDGFVKMKKVLKLFSKFKEEYINEQE